MKVPEVDCDSCGGVATVFYYGSLVGSPPDLSFVVGEKESIYVDGDTFSEFQICKFLRNKGVDIHYVRGFYFKGPNDPLHVFRPLNGNGDILEVAGIIRQHGGVHIYVDHEPDFAEVEPDAPLYIGWSEDSNVFDESSKVAGGDGYCSWEDSDSDLGAPFEGDEEFMNIVGGRWERKKKAEEDYRAFMEAMRRQKKTKKPYVQTTKKKPHVQPIKKTRAKRNGYSGDHHSTVTKKVSVKHTPTNRKRRKGVVDGGGNDGAQFGGNDGAQVGGNDDKDFWEEHRGCDYYGDPGASSSQQQTHQGEEENHDFAQATDAQPTATGGSSQCGAENVSAVDKEKERKKRHLDQIRRYKTMYTTLNLNEGFAKYVHNGESRDYGDRVCFDGQERSGMVGSYDSSSSDEDEFIVFPVENDPTSVGDTDIWYNEEWKVPYFQVGMRFTDYKQFKRAIQKYAVVRVAGISPIRNESKRQTYECSPGCPWRIHASVDGRGKNKCFRVKNYSWEHNCLQEPINNQATAKFVAEHYYKKLREEPSYTCREMMVDLYKDHGIAVGFSKCVRAKIIILTEMEGNFIMEYGLVVGYANYLKSVNPNNTVIVVSERKTRMPGSPRVFSKMYICLDVLKDGFKRGCRRVIGIDGTHLKGVCKGVLLVAISKDGNGQMYPIAWAVVDGESHETWSWFIDLLKKDLELGNGDNLTILSDKHKRIISARKQLLPNAEQRFCARHLFGNLRKYFPDAELENLYWRIVFAYDPRLFEKHMTLLRAKSRRAYEALLAFDVTTWSRSHFNHQTVTEDATNNIAETFNGWIRLPRGLPIISMMEAISDQIMTRRADFYNAMLIWEKETDICPYPWKRLKSRVRDAQHCKIVWDGRNSFRVSDSLYEMIQVVEMVPRTCSCGYWQLTGVPCSHVVRCCQVKGWTVEDFVSPCLKIDMYRAAYERPIECTRGAEMWRNYDGVKLEPPVFKRRPGRPKAKRIPSTGEIKRSTGNKFAWLGREGVRMKCTACLEQGHNRRGCPRLRQNTNGPQRSEANNATNVGNASDNNANGAERSEANNATRAANTSANNATNAQANNPTRAEHATATNANNPQHVATEANNSQADVAGANNTQHAADDPEVVFQYEETVDRAASQCFRRALRAQSRKLKKQKKQSGANASNNSRNATMNQRKQKDGPAAATTSTT